MSDAKPKKSFRVLLHVETEGNNEEAVRRWLKDMFRYDCRVYVIDVDEPNATTDNLPAATAPAAAEHPCYRTQGCPAEGGKHVIYPAPDGEPGAYCCRACDLRIAMRVDLCEEHRCDREASKKCPGCDRRLCVAHYAQHNPTDGSLRCVQVAMR